MLTRNSASEIGWNRRVALVRRCFVSSKADVISSVQSSWRGAHARASVSDRMVFTALGMKRR